MSNARASAVALALAATRYDLDADESCLTDLLTDLRHWCAANGRDFGREVSRSEMHFDAEGDSPDDLELSRRAAAADIEDLG